ncbi:hypothetical protein AQPE_2850 [Aquipluma nitroreducens]|uniref:Uncharacterized protein n=1 Tax=Aquipluma nitroreducens TaxID=2010828 RepID=A0A5K7SB47_9BACT|nr:hypothetical protein AQPE_2850 [Aquipluma nitroreducens]
MKFITFQFSGSDLNIATNLILYFSPQTPEGAFASNMGNA